MIYALICKTGDLPGIEYEIVAYYETEDEAKQGKQYYDEEQKYTEELVAIHGGYVVPRDYNIVSVMKSKASSDSINTLRSTFKKLIQEEKEKLCRNPKT